MTRNEDWPRDTRKGVENKDRTGQQDSSPQAAREIAKRVENEGGFWGKRKNA